jgi:hypothetical protein
MKTVFTPRMVLAFLVLIGGVLRLYDLGGKALWVDELYMLHQAEHVEEIAEVCAEGNTPPGRHYLVWALLGPTQPEARVRLPAALGGFLAIPLMFLFVRRATSQNAAFIAATLLALSPWHLLHSQDGRMYALFLFFVLLGLYFLWRALDEREWRWWALLGVSFALGAYISYFALWTSFIITVFTLIIGARRAIIEKGSPTRWKTVLGLCVALVAAAIAYAPWAPVILRLIFKYHAPDVPEYAPPPVNEGMPINPFLTQYDASYVTDFLGKMGSSSAAISYLLFALFVLGLVIAFQRHRRLFALTILWFVIPAGVLMISQGVRHFFPPRYLFFFLAPYYALVGLGVAWIGEQLAAKFSPDNEEEVLRNGALASVLILAIPLVSFLRDDIEYYRVEKQDWRRAVVYLEMATRQGEILLTGQAWSEFPVIFYGKSMRSKVELRSRVYKLDELEKALQSRRGTWLINWGPLIPIVQDIVDRNTTLVCVLPGIQGDIQIYRNAFTAPPPPPPIPKRPTIQGG